MNGGVSRCLWPAVRANRARLDAWKVGEVKRNGR